MRDIDAIFRQQVRQPSAFRTDRADMVRPRPGAGCGDGLVPALPAQAHGVVSGCQSFAGLRQARHAIDMVDIDRAKVPDRHCFPRCGTRP